MVFYISSTFLITAAEESKANLKMKSTDGSSQRSPRGVLEIPISGFHSDGGNNSESSSSERSISQDGRLLESHNSQWRNLIGGLLLRKSTSIRRLSTFPPSSRGSISERKSFASSPSGKDQSRTQLAQQEIPMRRPSWRNFDYQELVVATDNFSYGNFISSVYSSFSCWCCTLNFERRCNSGWRKLLQKWRRLML